MEVNTDISAKGKVMPASSGSETIFIKVLT